MTDRRRAIAYNALGRALRDADHWLPFSTRRAAVDSVLAAVDAEDQAAARPHACGNCEGIDPSSCIANPNRAARQTFPTGPCGCGAPATPDVVHRQGAPCYMDLDGSLQTVELPTAAARQTTPPCCTCARAWNFHSRDCALYVEGHELASPELAAARQTTGQDDADCPACEVGIEHTEHCPTPETHNWGCGCPTDVAPAVGQPAEAQATDRAALRERLRLAIAQQYLDDTGSGRTVGELDDIEFGSLADAALSVLTVEGGR